MLFQSILTVALPVTSQVIRGDISETARLIIQILKQGVVTEQADLPAELLRAGRIGVGDEELDGGLRRVDVRPSSASTDATLDAFFDSAPAMPCQRQFVATSVGTGAGKRPARRAAA